MNYKHLGGIIPALMTPFDESGVNVRVLKEFCIHLADCGVDGLYVGGSSGEMVLMTEDERKALLEAVVEAVGDRINIIAHIGSTSTKSTLELARHAEGCGAHALSSVTPFYFKYSFEEIKAFYRTIAEATSLPLIIYNAPALTGSALNFGQLCKILTMENIGGMKFTSSNFYELERLIKKFPDKVFYNGSDEMLLSGLAAGADGGIGLTYNFQPERFIEIYNKFRLCDMAGALEAQRRVNDAIEIVFKSGGIPAVKKLISFRGFEYGDCRPPFLPVSNEDINELKKIKLKD